MVSFPFGIASKMQMIMLGFEQLNSLPFTILRSFIAVGASW
jgi:hypothetical protein